MLQNFTNIYTFFQISTNFYKYDKAVIRKCRSILPACFSILLTIQLYTSEHHAALIQTNTNVYIFYKFNNFLQNLAIFYGIWIKQIGATVFIFNLDNVLLKKLFPTMNI